MPRVCPVWVGYLLASPVRKLWQDPAKILRPYVREGMTVLDMGSAMGFFSIPLAQMVGAKGRVVCVDMQPKMLATLEKRARKAGVGERIAARLCSADSLGISDLNGNVDFALAFAVVHEVPDQERLFAELAAVLKPPGTLLVAEPRGHVPEADFQQTLAEAARHGLAVAETPRIAQSRSVLLKKS